MKQNHNNKTYLTSPFFRAFISMLTPFIFAIVMVLLGAVCGDGIVAEGAFGRREGNLGKVRSVRKCAQC